MNLKKLHCKIINPLLPSAGLALFMSLITSAASFAAEIEAASRITAVTVYPDGATITRLAEIDLPAGPSTILVKGLPAALDPSSIRVEGQSSGSLFIAAVDTRQVPGDSQASADPALTVKIDILRSERERLSGKIDAAEGERLAVQRFAQASPEKLGTDGKPMDIADWPKAWAAIGEGLAGVNEHLRLLKAEAKRLDAEITALSRANPAGPRPGAPYYEVKAALETGSALQANLTLTYQVRGAAWTPIYDARLTTLGRSNPQLELARRAMIAQHTGEDWHDIRLQLSTVRLNRGTRAPNVETQTVTLLDPGNHVDEAAVRRDRAPAARVLRAPIRLALQKEALPAAPVSNAQPILADIDIGAYQAGFIVPGKVSLARDGTEKSFTLGSTKIEPEVSIKTAPSLDTTAYIEAGFINDEEVPLLPGQVMIHRDGIFVGRSEINLVASGDRMSLGFGADDAVKVTRLPVKKKANDGGFFGATRFDTQDYRTLIKNLHSFAVKVTMIDQLPVSENTAITVEPLATNTPATEKTIEEKRGVLGWSYELQPNEAKEVRLGWRMKWPADRELLQRPPVAR